MTERMPFSPASHIERIEADMKKALIIGAAGFVGNYLASQILSEGKWSLAATKMKHETCCGMIWKSMTWIFWNQEQSSRFWSSCGQTISSI